jgi:hypothetical protein
MQPLQSYIHKHYTYTIYVPIAISSSVCFMNNDVHEARARYVDKASVPAVICIHWLT